MSKKIALVAHDSQKENLVNFIKNHEDFFLNLVLWQHEQHRYENYE